MEFDKHLNWDDESVSVFQEGGHFIVYYEGLTGVVKAIYKALMFLLDETWHQIAYCVKLIIIFIPSQQFSKPFINLNYPSKTIAISINNKEIWIFKVLLAGRLKILVINLIHFQNAFHLSNVGVIANWVIQQVKLDHW